MNNDINIIREGYCCYCDNKPEMPLPEAAAIAGHPCNGCWFRPEKKNWKPKGGQQYYAEDGTLMNGDGSRSIFDDVDK